jgi:hypothetical protein
MMPFAVSLSRRIAGAACLAVGFAAHAAVPAPAYPDFLLVHFSGEGADGEQIHFAVSTDGHRFTDLNGSRPVLTSALGEKGVRDPSVLRSADGKKFYILATDLRIASGKGWDAAMHHGSTRIVIWESGDLLNWSAPRLVDIAGNIPGAGCAWAPEAIVDEASGDYIVYWTTIAPANGLTKPRIYYSRTRDFTTFTPAQLYIDRPGTAGLIDTQIIRIDEPGATYRYVRASGDGQITLEGSQSILGAWTVLGDLRPVGLTGKDVEGPILYRMPAQGTYGLWVDQYASGRGYLALETADLARPETLRRVDPGAVSYGASLKRHGGILNIGADEYRRLLATWPAAAASRP